MEDDDFQSRLADWSTRNVGNEPEEKDEEERAPVVQDEPQAEQAQAPFSEDQLSGFMERNSPSRIGMYLGNAVHSFNSTMGDIAATLNAGIGTMVRERDGVNKLGIVMRGGQNVLDANADFARKARVGEELLALDSGEIKDISDLSDDAKAWLIEEGRREGEAMPGRTAAMSDDMILKIAAKKGFGSIGQSVRDAAQSKEWQQTREDSVKYLQNRARENGFAFSPKSQRSDAWESEFMEQMRLSDMARNAEQRKPLNELPDRDVVLRSPEQIWNQRASDRVHEAEAAYNAHSAASQASRTFFNDAISNNLVDINAQNEYLHNLGFKYGGEKGEGFWGRTGETLERMLVDVTDQTGNITLMLAAQGAIGLAAKASAAAQGATAVAGGAVAEAATSLGMADVAMAATRTAAVNTAKSVGLQAMGRALQAGFIASEFQGAMDEARDLGIPDAEAARHAMEYGVVAGVLENAGQIINVAGLNGKTVSKFGRAVFGNKAFNPEALATLAGTMKQAGVKIGARIIDQVADATGEGLEEITQTTAQGMAMAAVIDEYCDRHNLNKAEFLAAHDGAPYKIGEDGTVRYDIGKAVEEIRESGLAGAGSALGTSLLGMGGGVAKRAFRGRTAAVAGVSAVTGLNATRLEAVYGDNACEVVAHALAGVRNDEDVAKRREILANEVSDEDFGEDALRLFDYCIDNAKVTETAAMSGLSSKFQVPVSMNEGWEESDGGALWSYSNDGITIVQDVINNEITVLNGETGQTVKADSPNAALAAANRYSIENQARQAVLANRVEYFGNMMQRLAPEDFKRTSVYMTTREALEKEPDIRNSLIADIGEDVVAAAREIGGDEAVNALLESKFEGGTLNDGRIVFAADKMSGPWKMMQLINHETTHSGILSANSWDKKKSADFIRNMNVAKPQGFDAEAERGFRGLTESQRNSFAWQFWMRADRIKRNLGYEEGSPKLMEETIAYFFQDRANRPSMWTKMKHALFQTLRDNAGRNIALQESDIEVMVDAWRHDPGKLTKVDNPASEAPAADTGVTPTPEPTPAPKSETTPKAEPTPAPKTEATPKAEPTPAAAPKTETPTPAPETAKPAAAPAAMTETPVETAAAKPSGDEKAPEVRQPKAEETPAAKTETTPAPETAPKAENAASAEESAKTPAEWLAEKGIAIHKGTYDAVTKKLAESKDHDTVSGVLERRILPENAPALSQQTRKTLISKLNKMGFRVNEKSSDATLLGNLLEKYTDETGRAAPASATTATPAAATPAESKSQTKARGPSAYITPTEKSRTIPISKLRTLKDEPQKSIDNAWGFMEKAARGEADKRKPIHVVDNGDGTFTVIDGNATTWAMARHGETEIIAEVVGKDRGTRIANSHYEIQEEGVKDADGNKIALRAGGFDGMDVKSEAAREKAYADAEENLPALEELTRKAAAKVGGEVMLHPENKAGADTDEREVGKRVKKRSRVEDKKADYKGDYSGVVDLIGTTITLTPDKDMSDAVKAIRKNLPEGASVARVKFLSNPDKGGYWDVKVSVRFANGGIGEIIVADAYLTEAKFGRGGHELYDYQRALEDAKETDAEAADLYFALKQIELAIYSHNTPQAEAWRAGWDSAKATASSSLTRFLASHGRDFISSIDMGSLKDLLSGTHLHQPASLDSYATPAFSFIQNDISSSSSNDNNIIAKSGEKGKKEVGRTAPTKASNSFSVITPDGEMTVEGKWEAVPADKIVTSFDPRYKQFERHMQNRITTGKTNEQKVEKYANNPLYRMAGNSEISDTGAAFGVWHDGLCYIVAGNHHTRGIQLSFERGKGTQFEADARADMERRGVKVPDGNFIPIRIVDGMTREQLVEFADKSNQRATQEHRDGEKAVKDVPIIKRHISKLHADADLTSRDNIDFVEALLKEFKDESLRNSDLTPNDKAYRRVRLALVASVLSATDEDAATTLTQVFAEKAESLGLQNIIDGVTRAAAPVLSATDAAKGTNLDFGRHLAEALRVIVDFKQNGGKSMKGFLAQEGFDFGDKQALSGEAKALAQAMAENANAPQRISALLSDVATRVEKAVGEKEQAGLFAAEEAPNLEKIVNASVEAMSGKASAAEVDALRNRAPALFDALWKDKDGTSEALSEVERQMNHVRDSKDKSSAIRPFAGNAEARKQAMKYWGAEHPAGKSKLAPGPVTVKPEAPAKSETAKPAEAPAAPEAPAQAPAPQTSTKAKKPAAKPRATKDTTTEEAAPAPVSQTPATPQAPTAQQGGTTIAGVELSADDIKAFSDLGSGIMASFSRGDVDADTVSKGNQFVGLAVQRGVKDFRTFATLAKRFVYGKADGERRAGVQNFLAARWSQYLMDNPDSGIEEMLPSKMRTVFDEIDNEQTAPAPAPTQENTQNQEQKNEAPSTNETREEASENPVKEPEANPVERTEAQREPPKPVKRETPPRAPAKAKHTVVGKPLQPIIAAAPTSRSARLAANIEAIRIAKELNTTGRTATEAEREKLAKFTGWGGLGSVFNYYDERSQLEQVLEPNEMEAAKLSANSAYFTPTNITSALWDIARALGFNGGTMLEGSAGVGNIISAIPQDLRANTDVRAVEIDPISALILQGLHPQIAVDVNGFQDVNIPAGSVNLAITNVPFVTGLRVYDKNNKDLSDRFKDLHDFCIAKNIRALAEGGIGIFITTSNTLDKSDALRRWITDQGNADVIGAFRMPNDTFGGTAVTSDIIVVRKRVGGEKSAAAIDVSTALVERTGEYDGKTTAMYLNKYFHDHPEMMGGEMAFNFEKGETYRATTYGLFPAAGIDAKARLADFVKSMEGKRSEMKRPEKDNAPREQHTFKLEDETIHEGELHVAKNGEVCIARGGESVPLDMKSMKNKVAGANGKGKYTRTAVVKDYADVKTSLHALLDAQKDAGKSEADIESLMKKFNGAYDWFVRKYGPLNLNNRISWLDRDIYWPELCALETITQDTNPSNKGYVATIFNAKDGIYTHFGKSDVFKKRVISVEKAQKPANVTDAILLDYRNTAKVSAENVAKMLGISTEDATTQMLESGLAFIDPATSALTIRHDYLSGNVREKLAIAQAQNENGKYDANIKALNEVMPPTVPAHLIGYTLGSTWLPTRVYTKFFDDRFDAKISLQNIGGRWVIGLPSYAYGKNFSSGVLSSLTGKRISGAEIAAAAMKGQSTIPVTLIEKIGESQTQTIHDRAAESTISAKIDEIRDDFKSFVQKMARDDEAFAAEVEGIYNERFNNLAKRVIDDRFLPDHFEGANPEKHLYPHQKRAVILGTTQPVMLAHEVGSGKTYTLITTAMEMRRLGTARKPMIVVQNATIGQFVASAKNLYPAARVLAPSKSDTGEAGRKEFFAKAKFNDWDMIIVPQSMFGMIPDSEESQMQYIAETLEEKRQVLEAISKEDDKESKRATAQIEKEIGELVGKFRAAQEKSKGKAAKKAKDQALADEKVKERAKRLLDRKVDEVETFQDMDIDALLIDEAHNYKKLGFSTALSGRNSRVKGIDTTASKKAVSTYMKIRSILASQNGRNVVMATGTPISNTAAEIWTFMRYLMPIDARRSYGLEYFDDFVHNFGDISQLLEFNTSGQFKENTRFAGYFNTPELVRLWQTVSDTVLAKDTVVSKALPDVDGGAAQDVFLPQTPTLAGTMKSIREWLKEYEAMSGREKKENSHIPLVAFGRAKAAAIDVRLLDPTEKDEPGSKTNMAVGLIVEDLKSTTDHNGTVAVFCDRNKHQTDGKVDFNLFDDMKQKLISRGIPAEQIAIIEPGMTDSRKVEIFDKIKAGEIRVVFGSTETLGTGVNIQDRLHMAIHMDAPPRPMDYTQRNGRILRQGNKWKIWGQPIRIVRFGVEDCLDVSAYQRLKTKSEFINSVMNLSAKDQFDALESRSIEDSEEEGVFDNPVATLSGSQYALLKNKAERDLRKLRAKQESYEADQIYLKRELEYIPGRIKFNEDSIAEKRAELQKLRDAGFTEEGARTVEFDGKKFAIDDKDGISKQLSENFNKQLVAARKEAQGVTFGASYHKVLNLPVKVDGVEFTVRAIVKAEKMFSDKGLPFMRSTTEIGWVCPALDKKTLVETGGQWATSAFEGIAEYTKGAGLRSDVERTEGTIRVLHAQEESARARYGIPFAEEEALKEAEARVKDYEQKMKEELAAKEAKYADVKAAQGMSLDAAAQEEADNSDMAQGAAFSRGDEDMDAEGYFGNERYDGFRVNMQDIATAAESENAPLRPEAAREFADTGVRFSIREEDPPKNTGIGYKVFFLKNGKLYPPMVANPNGADTPIGPWLNADEGVRAEKSKNGRDKVKAGGKGTQGGGGTLAWRPGWHLGTIPYALQFNRGEKVDNPLGIRNQNGEVIKVGRFFPANFVWAEVEYAADVDYQEEAMSYGITPSGKFQHSLAGLPRLPKDGFYQYRTNANPATDPWIITGAMRVRRVLSDDEVDALVREAGREPQEREARFTADDAKSVNSQLTHSVSPNEGEDGVMFSRSDADRFEVTPEEAAAIRILDIHGGKNYLVGASQLARFYSQHEYSPEHLTKEKVWEESFGIDAPALVSEIVKRPRVLTPYEHAAMVRHLASYEARLDMLTQKQDELEKTPGTPTETLATLDNEIAVLGGAIKTIYAAFDYAGTKAGQALAFRNLIQNAEMTAGWMIRRMKKQMENFHVDAMPTGFMDELERFAREYKQVKQDLETAQGELVRKDAEAEQMNEILRNLRNRPKKDPGTRLAEIMSQTQDLVDAQGELSDYQIEKLVKKVAAEYVALDSSYRDIDTLLGEVQKYLDIAGIELDDAQVREYFAGRANIYDRNEARKLANRLQKQVAKAVALEEALQNGDIKEMRRVCRRLGLAIHDGQAIIDAQNAAILAMLDDEIAELEAELGEKPKPTMFSLDENAKASRPAGGRSAAANVADNGKARLERLRALRAEIANADADETRTARIREYARSRLAREQARLQNVIGKTHEDAGTVPPASTPELEDAERELRNAEREEREARRRGEQNVANQEQKRIQRLREKVAALEKQVLDAQEGFFMNDMPKMKKRRAMSDEETALVQRVAELRHAYRTLLDAQFPGEQSAEERAIRARQRAIQRSIDHLQNKMEGSEQAQSQPKHDYSNDPRLAGLKQRLREKKKEYLEWEAAQNWKKMPLGGKALKTVADFFDLTKSLVASGDLSAIWTQCGWMMLGNPRLNVRAVRDGLRALFSGKQSEEIMNKLARDYDLARFVEDGLQIHAVGTAAESEMFARDSNPWLNKLIPQDNMFRKLSGMWLEASARGFDTPINIIRASTYAAALDACQKNGKMLGKEERQTLAQLINYATGTGDSKFFKNEAAKRLLWAPSRISGQIQTIQNMINLGLSSISENIATQKFRDIDLDVRRTMFKQVYGKAIGNYILLTAVLYALSRLMWDDDDDDKRLVGKEFFNPLSAQFLKYNLNGNYFAPLGGVEIYLRTAARTVAGGRTDRYGRFKEFDGHQNGTVVGEIGTTFVMNKLSPTMQLVAAALNREAKFETLETPGQILQFVVQNTVYPLTLHDSVEALTENGIPAGAALSIMNLVGLSSWSYGHVKRDTAVRNFSASLKAYNEFAKNGEDEKLRALMNRYDWLKPQYRVRLVNLAGQYRKLADKNKKMIAAGHANTNMMARQAQLAEQIYAIMHEAEGQ